ncbi:disulfide bond formation protein B [Dankookia sp. GCM10030260]
MLLVAALAAAAPIFARASEGIWGIAPCALCLWQRWPYWVAAALALAAAAWPRGRRLLGGLALVAVLASGAVGGFHVGVEQGWWPSPLPGCQAPRAGSGGSVEDMLRALSAAPSKPCDAPTYLVPGLPVSMAAMNVLYALGLSGLGLILWRRGAKA